jgi:hypothetical protein
MNCKDKFETKEFFANVVITSFWQEQHLAALVKQLILPC